MSAAADVLDLLAICVIAAMTLAGSAIGAVLGFIRGKQWGGTLSGQRPRPQPLLHTEQVSLLNECAVFLEVDGGSMPEGRALQGAQLLRRIAKAVGGTP